MIHVLTNDARLCDIAGHGKAEQASCDAEAGAEGNGRCAACGTAGKHTGMLYFCVVPYVLTGVQCIAAAGYLLLTDIPS